MGVSVFGDYGQDSQFGWTVENAPTRMVGLLACLARSAAIALRRRVHKQPRWMVNKLGIRPVRDNRPYHCEAMRKLGRADCVCLVSGLDEG